VLTSLKLTSKSNSPDPPLPGFLVDNERGVFTPAQSTAQATASISATSNGRSIGSDNLLITALMSFNGKGVLGWSAGQQHAAVFDMLNASHVNISDGNSNEFDTIVTASPNISAVALIQGQVNAQVSGSGHLSLYPSALAGLAAGASWETYSARLGATTPFSITLTDVPVISSSGNVYTGPLSLVASDYAELSGSGATLAPDFAHTTMITGTQAGIMFGPSTVTSGSLPSDPSNGFALANYSGPLTVTHLTSDTDQIELASSADYFAVHASPASSTTDPTIPVTFHTVIDSSASDTYTTTVEAPGGWNVALDATGLVTATPSLNASPGDYTVLVTIQSASHPDLFASATHMVTIVPHQGMVLQVSPDPLTTVPFGPADPNAVPGDTNNGQLQLTGAAYTVDITNTSTTSHTFTINVSGLPAGWTILSGSQDPTSTAVTLPPGGFGQVGLYISPTVASLPPAGTQYPFSVRVASSDSPSLDQSATQTFTVPAIAFSHLTTDQAMVYSSPGLTTTIDLGIQNVGNLAGTVPLSITQPISTWTATLTSPISLDAGQTMTQSVTLHTPEGNIGQTYPVQISAPAGGYTQTVSINVQLVGQNALVIDQAAQVAAQLYPSNTSLSTSLQALGQRIDQLRSACATATTLGAPGQTSCSTDLRDAVVTAANQVANAADTISPMFAADSVIRQTAQALSQDTAVQSSHLAAQLEQGRHKHLVAIHNAGTIGSTVFSDLDALTSAVTALQTQLGEVAAHGARLAFSPGRRVVLGASPAAFNLSLTNQGSVTTTYTVTLTPSSPTVALSPTVEDLTVAPGAVITIPVTATSATLGSAIISATVAVADAPDLSALTEAVGVTSVDALLRLTGITVNPPFVEYGSGGTPAVDVQIANVANEAISGTARLRLMDATGTEVYSATQPIQVASALNPVDYSLGTLSTTGLLTGTYTVTVDILDSSSQIIPQASAQSTLGIGQAVHAVSAVSPAIVAPGNVTVTTFITTQLDLSAIGCLTSTNPGGIFITGHDPDDHAYGGGNPIGAQHIIQRAVAFVTAGKLNPRMLLVTDLRNPGGDQVDSRLGLQAAGFTGYDVADYGSGTPGILDLHGVNFGSYDVVVIASDYGGWLRQDELDILNTRSADLLAYVNHGGGIVAFAESGGRADGSYPGTSHDRFAFLPFVVSALSHNQGEAGFTVTITGTVLGLTNTDVNGNASHNVFTAGGGLNIIDTDASGETISLAEYGRAVTSGGVCSSSSAANIAKFKVALRATAPRRARSASLVSTAHPAHRAKITHGTLKRKPTLSLPRTTGYRHIGDAHPLAYTIASSDVSTPIPAVIVTPSATSTAAATMTPTTLPTDVPTSSVSTTATSASTVTPTLTRADTATSTPSLSPIAIPTSIVTTTITSVPTAIATAIPPVAPPTPQNDQGSSVPPSATTNPAPLTTPQLPSSNTTVTPTSLGSSTTMSIAPSLLPTSRMTITPVTANSYVTTATTSAVFSAVKGSPITRAIRSSYSTTGDFAVTDFATGFVYSALVGPVGLAVDPLSGDMFVMNYTTGYLYKFGPEGGIASAATQVNAASICCAPAGLSFSKDGRLYLARQAANDVVELNPLDGTVIRVVAGVCSATGIAVDPLSGDLFVSGCTGINRVFNPGSTNATVMVYSAVGSDGLAFGPDGTLYNNNVSKISGTNAMTPVLTTPIVTVPYGDGIAVAASNDPHQPPFLLINRNDGTITKIDLTTNPPMLTDIVTGGSRGDFATVGLDGCLYATQTDKIIKVTDSKGHCTLVPNVIGSYAVNVDHTVPLPGVTVLTDTSVPTLTATISDTAQERLLWQQTLTPTVPVTTVTFQAFLPNMQPGEVRPVASGTVITYAGSSGEGVLHLGPLYVAAAHLVALTPPAQQVGFGGQAVYTITLSNPTQASLTLTPTVAGLPEGWASAIGSRTLSAGEEISVPLTVSVPSSGPGAGNPSLLGDHPFTVLVQTDSSGQDQAGASLTVINPLDLAVVPPVVAGSGGDVVTYTVTLTNHEVVDRSYTLTTTDLAPNVVALPSTVNVPAGQATSVPITVAIHALVGLYAFTVRALAGTEAARTADAVLNVLGDRRVAATLMPAAATGGPGVPVLYQLGVTNTASLSDTYGFTVQTPPGWSSRIEANGLPHSTLSLSPYVLNAATLSLIVTPTTDTAPGDYPVTVTVGSRNDPVIQAVTSATLTVSPYGVQVSLSPRHTTLDPTGTGTWQVTVTNTGIRPDTYDLAPTGIISSSARVTPATVSLNPGQSQVVQMTAGPLLFALAQTFGFGVTAQSQAEPAVHNADTGDITFTGYHAVEAALQPSAQTLTNTLQTSYTLLITNTGNLDSFYTFAPLSTPAGPVLTTELPMLEVPAHATSALLLTALGKAAGAYALTVQVASTEGAASGTASGSLVIDAGAVPSPTTTSIAPATPTVTSSPTITPTAMATPTPTLSPQLALTPTQTPIASVTVSPSPRPSMTATLTAQSTATTTPSPTPSFPTPTLPAATPMASPSATTIVVAQATATSNPVPPALPPAPTLTSTGAPSASSVAPTTTPTALPTNTPRAQIRAGAMRSPTPVAPPTGEATATVGSPATATSLEAALPMVATSTPTARSTATAAAPRRPRVPTATVTALSPSASATASVPLPPSTTPVVATPTGAPHQEATTGSATPSSTGLPGTLKQHKTATAVALATSTTLALNAELSRAAAQATAAAVAAEHRRTAVHVTATPLPVPSTTATARSRPTSLPPGPRQGHHFVPSTATAVVPRLPNTGSSGPGHGNDNWLAKWLSLTLLLIGLLALIARRRKGTTTLPLS